MISETETETGQGSEGRAMPSVGDDLRVRLKMMTTQGVLVKFRSNFKYFF